MSLARETRNVDPEWVHSVVIWNYFSFLLFWNKCNSELCREFPIQQRFKEYSLKLQSQIWSSILVGQYFSILDLGIVWFKHHNTKIILQIYNIMKYVTIKCLYSLDTMLLLLIEVYIIIYDILNAAWRTDTIMHI